MAILSDQTFWSSTNSTCSLLRTAAHVAFASNRHLLTLNVALIALYSGLQSAGYGQSYWALFRSRYGNACLPPLVSDYQIVPGKLNTVKFKVIHELEEHLPAALFRYEWELAEHGRGKSYSPVTHIEQWLPLAFCVLYFVLAVVLVVASAGLLV